MDKYYAETKKEEINKNAECWAAEANIIKINEIYEEEKKVKLETKMENVELQKQT